MSKDRGTWISVPDMYRLNASALIIAKAFDGDSPYLVGSALTKRDYRDVDVRMMLDHNDFVRMFRSAPGWLMLANAAVSDWMAKATGLPIDFQFQDIEEANRDFDGRRHPLGIPFEYNPEMSGKWAVSGTETVFTGLGARIGGKP